MRPAAGEDRDPAHPPDPADPGRRGGPGGNEAESLKHLRHKRLARLLLVLILLPGCLVSPAARGEDGASPPAPAFGLRLDLRLAHPDPYRTPPPRQSTAEIQLPLLPLQVPMVFEVDTLAGTVVYQAMGLDGSRGGTSLVAVDQDQLARAGSVNTQLLQKTLAEGALKAKAEGGDHIEIDIPFKVKSKTFRRIFGSGRIGLNVHGNINMRGTYRAEKRESESASAYNNNRNDFRLEQEQQFTVVGKIGEKVDVHIDQNTERNFDFENNLSIIYTGEPEEIIESISAGNISLNLPSTKYVSFSDKSSGLFGLKMVNRLGPLRLTGIASTEKNESKQQTFTGSSSEKQAEFGPGEHVTGIFFLNEYYRHQYRVYYRNNWDHIVGPRIGSLTLYEFDASPTNTYDLQLVDPAGNPATGATYKMKRTEWDATRDDQGFTVDRDLGIIRLTRIQEGRFIAVGYTVSQPQALQDWFADNRDYALNMGKLSAATGDSVVVVFPDHFNPDAQPYWDLQLRNVFRLGTPDMDPNQFDMTIGKVLSGGRDQNTQDGTDYLSVLYLDVYDKGAARPGSDHRVDEQWVEKKTGYISFPSPYPFSSHPSPTPFNQRPESWVLTSALPGQTDLQDSLGLGAAYAGLVIAPNHATIMGGALDEVVLLANPDADMDTLYQLRGQYFRQSPDAAWLDLNQRYRLRSTAQVGTEVISLGWNVTNVTVTANNRRLIKDTDYTLDEQAGLIRIINPTYTTKDQKIQVSYETPQLFQLRKKTFAGVTAELDLWDSGREKSKLGAAWIYFNEETAERKTRLGNEPVKNVVFDLNARLLFQPRLMTQWMDALPLIEADAPSTLDFEAEYAMVIPDPNPSNNPDTGDRHGVAYVDDFESSKQEIPLSVGHTQWFLGARPEHELLGLRGWMGWYNPRVKVPSREIWPQYQESNREGVSNEVRVLRLEYEPFRLASMTADGADTSLAGEPLARTRSWGGLYYDFRNAYDDFSDKKFIELTLLVEGDRSGSLNLDLGQVSEDALPNSQRDTEDGNDDYKLQESEDLGLDNMAGPDPPWPLPDSLFAWSGTRGELFQQFGARYGFSDSSRTFDWWDLDGDGARDPAEPWSYDDYVRVETAGAVIDKSHGWEGNSQDSDQIYPDTEDRNGNLTLDTANNYFSYRVPLNPADPAFSDYVFENSETDWLFVRIPLRDARAVLEGNPQLSLVNGIRLWMTGFRSPVRVTLAELNIVGNEWRKASLAVADTVLQQTYEISVLNNYDNSDFYYSPPGVSGQKDLITGVEAREQSLALDLQALPYGTTAWARKQMAATINLAEYRELKMFIHGGSIDTLAYRQRYGQDKLECRLRLLSTENDYYEYTKFIRAGWDPANNLHILFSEITGIDLFEGARRGHEEPDKPVLLADGGQIRVVGNPSITKIRSMLLGVTNHGSEPAATQVWFNELRVSDVKKEISRAMRAEVSAKFSDVLTVSSNYERKDADYHTVKERAAREGAAFKESYSIGAGTDLGRLLPPSLGLNAKLDVNASSNLQVPKFYPNDDQEVDLEDHPEWVENRTRTSSASLSLRKSSSKSWLALHTLDKTSLSTDVSQSISRNVTTAADTSFTQNVRLSYSDQFKWTHQLKPLAFAADWPLMKKAGALEIGYFPQSLSLGASTRRDIRHTWRRDLTNSSTETYTLSRNWSTAFKPLKTLTVNLQRSYDNNLKFRRPQARIPDPLPDGNPNQDASEDFRSRLTAWRDQPADLQDGDHSIRQTLTFAWAPTLVSWSTTSFGYNTTYNWSRELADPGRGVSLGNTGKFTADFKLDPGKLARKALWMSDAALGAARKELADQKSARRAEHDRVSEERAQRREEKRKAREGTGAALPQIEPAAGDSLGLEDFLPPDALEEPVQVPADSVAAAGARDLAREAGPQRPAMRPARREARPDSAARTEVLTPRPLMADSLLALLPDSLRSKLAAMDSLIKADASLRGVVDSTRTGQAAPPAESALPDSMATREPSRLLTATRKFLGKLWKRLGVASGIVEPLDVRFGRDGSRTDPGLAVFPWTPVGRRHASPGYQLALDPDPGFDTLRIANTVFSTGRSFGYDYALGTRVNLTKELPLKLGYDYSFSQQYSNERETSRREARTGWYVFSNDKLTGKGALDSGDLVGANPSLKDLPNYGFSLRKINRLPLLAKPFKDLNLTHDYKGKLDVAYSQGTEGMQRSQLTYSRDFNPLAGLDFQLGKGWGGSANYKVSRSLKINDPDRESRSASFVRSRGWTASAQKTLKDGFKLPGFKRRFKNDTTLRLTYDNSRKLTLNSKLDTESEAEPKPLIWNTPQNTSTWSLTFNTDYKFSRNVTGGASWKYGVEHSGTANDRKSYMEFQMSCRIEVRSR